MSRTFTHYKITNELQSPDLSGIPDRSGISYSEQLKNIQINILSKTDYEMVFDLIGVDSSIANALRRIILAEVPAVAIEYVYFSENSSIIQDEVLSHRLGLIPINCDPEKLEYVQGEEETDSDTGDSIIKKFYSFMSLSLKKNT